MEAAPSIFLSFEITHMILSGSCSPIIRSASSPGIPSATNISLMTSFMDCTTGGRMRLVFSAAALNNCSSPIPSDSATWLLITTLESPFCSTSTTHRYIMDRSWNSLCGMFFSISSFCMVFTSWKMILSFAVLISSGGIAASRNTSSIASAASRRVACKSPVFKYFSYISLIYKVGEIMVFSFFARRLIPSSLRFTLFTVATLTSMSW